MARVIDTFEGKPGKMYFVKGKGKKKTLCEATMKNARKTQIWKFCG